MVYFNQQIKEDKIMRVIYMIEGFTQDGDLEFRRFAHTKRIAERIKKKIILLSMSMYVNLIKTNIVL